MGWVYNSLDGHEVYYCQELNNSGFTQAVSTSSWGNQALHTGDLPKLVQRNRSVFLEALKAKQSPLITAEQVHGIKIQLVDRAIINGFARGLIDSLPQTDAMITLEPGIFLGILTADCLPIFVCDPLTPAVGLIHAGWRGSLNRIAPLTIAAMTAAFGTNPSQCWIGLGPAICSKCYQVGPEIAEQFRELVPEAVKEENSFFQLDLKLFNTSLLREAGIDSNRIITATACTCCQSKLYFSYRGQAGTSGRMMSLIGLKN